MGNITLEVELPRVEKGPSKKNSYISLEFRAMMPSKYTAYERFKLREFEKAVMGKCSTEQKNSNKLR